MKKILHSVLAIPMLVSPMQYPTTNDCFTGELIVKEEPLSKEIFKDNIRHDVINIINGNDTVLEAKIKENERIRIEEERRRAEEERIRKEEEARKAEEERKKNTIDFTLTFYTSLDCENGYGAITCEGKPLRSGIVASNVIPLHTKIILEGYGEVEVADRGGSEFNSPYRLDVFVARQAGETDSQYKRRIMEMGRQTVKGRIVK